MRYGRLDIDPEDSRLGRFIPDDWDHIDKYPLSTLAAEKRPTSVPVVIGVNWYAEFNRPELDDATGEYFVARGGAGSLTQIRGGQCVCLEPGGEPSLPEWWDFYYQGPEGSCVGMGWSHCMSILNNELYAARWLWDRAKEIDQWPETNPGHKGGTSVRAAAEILASRGHVDWKDEYADDDYSKRAHYKPIADNGIKTFRWAQSVDDVHRVLQNAKADELGAVPFLNSFGRAYPHRTWMPDAVLDRLMREDGEIAVPTDR